MFVRVVFVVVFTLRTDGRCEKAYRVCHPGRERPYEIAQAEKRTSVRVRGLLTEQREHRILDKEIVPFRIGAAQPVNALHRNYLIQSVEYSVGFLKQLHGFGGFGTLFLRKSRKPHGTAGIATVDIGYCRKLGLKAPGMEKINPVDVGTYFMDFIIDG